MSNQEAELELWCYDRALSVVTRLLVAANARASEGYYTAMHCVSEARDALGVAGYGNSGKDRPRPVAKHFPPGLGAESRRLHREYSTLVRAQRGGAENAADVIRVTDEAARLGIVLVPGGEKDCEACDGRGRVSVRIKNEAGGDDDTEVSCEACH